MGPGRNTMDMIGLLYSIAWTSQGSSRRSSAESCASRGDATDILVPEMVGDMRAVMECRAEAAGQLMSHLTLD